MKTRNIFKSLSVFSLLVSAMLVWSGCDPGPRQGPKSGEPGEEPEAYGLQEDDVPGGGEDPEADDNQINTAEGETLKMASEGNGEYDEEEAMYPEEKIQEETNLEEDDDPLELDGVLSVQRKMLIATLNGQRNDLEAYIRTLQQAPGTTEDSSVLEGNVEKLKTYLNKLDLEMAKVRAAEEENFGQVAESAQAAIEGAGALVASRNMRIDQGY